MVNVDDLKTHIVERERCQRYPAHSLFCESLHSKGLWPNESLGFVPRDYPIRNTTNDINVLVLHVSRRACPCLAHATFFDWYLQTFHRTLIAFLSPTVFISGASRVKGRQRHQLRQLRQLTQCLLGTKCCPQGGWHCLLTSFSRRSLQNVDSTWWLVDFFHWIHADSIGFSVSSDVSMIFKGFTDERTSKFPHS